MSELRIACALLAAGSSRRLGSPKQLLSWRGTSLVCALATELVRARTDASAVVLGYERARLRAELVGFELALLDNPDFEQGMASSIRVAVAWAEAQRADGLILCACDQPRLSARHVDELVCALRGGASAVASVYDRIRGIPAGFAAPWFPSLRALEGDRGARALLRARADVQEVVWQDGASDVDTAMDVERLNVETGRRSTGSSPLRAHSRRRRY